MGVLTLDDFQKSLRSKVVFSCRNPEESGDSLFFKLLERSDSAPAGKLPGARPENMSAWSSVEIDVGFKQVHILLFLP